jgi:hypothetical protein
VLGPWVKFTSAETLEKALRYLGATEEQVDERMACDAANRAGKQSHPAAALLNRKNLLRIDWSKL